MDATDVLITTFLFSCVLVLIYIRYMSRCNGELKKMNVPFPQPWPVLGNLPEMANEGMYHFQKRLYRDYSQEKMYGYYEPGKAILVVRDLDLVKDVLVTQFSKFTNHRIYTDEEPFGHVLPYLKDNAWRRVRASISSTFTPHSLKRMCHHLQDNVRVFVASLETACQTGSDVELKDAASCFTIDAIAKVGFGVEIDSLHERNNRFVREAENLVDTGIRMAVFTVLFPFLIPILKTLQRGVLPKESMEFFSNFVKEAMEAKRQDEQIQKRHDFIRLLVETSRNQTSSYEPGEHAGGRTIKGLSTLEIQGQALALILAGYESLSTVIAFTFHLLAHNPDCCNKVQDEIDEVIGSEPPTYGSIQGLCYLDQCVNEAMRLYPPGPWLDRECNEDCVIGDVSIPKGTTIVVPVVGIHTDPEHWPHPDKFDPDRFTPENKSRRHRFAFLPFGKGPRVCLGMRLAVVIIKLNVASVLQRLTPELSSKSVRDVTIDNFLMKTKEGLWVKFIRRLLYT